MPAEQDKQGGFGWELPEQEAEQRAEHGQHKNSGKRQKRPDPASHEQARPHQTTPAEQGMRATP